MTEPSTLEHRSRCEVCAWTSETWPTRDLAGCEATWHVYEEHPEVWREFFGDRPPRDPDPRLLPPEVVERERKLAVVLAALGLEVLDDPRLRAEDAP